MNKDSLRSYLLGSVSARASEQIEIDLLRDDAAFEQLLAIEDELIDEYVRRRLSAADEARFLEYFQKVPGGPEKVKFARTLDRYLSQASIDQASADNVGWAQRGTWQRLRQGSLRPVAAAATLAVICGGGLWTLSSMRDMRSQFQEARLNVMELDRRLVAEQARNEELVRTLQEVSQERMRLDRELSAARNSRDNLATPLSPPSFQLIAGTLRTTSAARVLQFPMDVPLIELRLDLALDAYATYEAALVDAEGNELMMIRQLDTLEMEEQWVVLVPMPTQLLKPGDYYVSLSGSPSDGAREALGRYAFRIPRQ